MAASDERITRVNENDVISGRKGVALKHPGNLAYRKLVGLNKELYATCPKNEKLRISKSIVYSMIEDLGGRFLEREDGKTSISLDEKDENGNPVVWRDIGMKKAVEKTSQALREGQPKILKKLALKNQGGNVSPQLHPRLATAVNIKAETIVDNPRMPRESATPPTAPLPAALSSASALSQHCPSIPSASVDPPRSHPHHEAALDLLAEASVRNPRVPRESATSPPPPSPGALSSASSQRCASSPRARTTTAASNERITQVNENDIINGRKGVALKHPGNLHYRKLVGLNKELYATCLKNEKLRISKSIVYAMIEVLGGRFLEREDGKTSASLDEKDEEGNPVVWRDIGVKKAVEKTSQALREGQPKLLRKLAMKRRGIDVSPPPHPHHAAAVNLKAETNVDDPHVPEESATSPTAPLPAVLSSASALSQLRPSNARATTAVSNERITEVNENDVINGRKGVALKHPGNLAFRKIVGRNKELYATCVKNDKLRISKSIVSAMREVGGRFLEREDGKTSKSLNEKDENGDPVVWREIGDKRAIEKTSQALREGQPKLLEKLALLKKEAREDAPRSHPHHAAALTLKGEVHDDSPQSHPHHVSALSLLAEASVDSHCVPRESVTPPSPTPPPPALSSTSALMNLMAETNVDNISMPRESATPSSPLPPPAALSSASAALNLLAEASVENTSVPRESITSPPRPPPAAALSSAFALSNVMAETNADNPHTPRESVTPPSPPPPPAALSSASALLNVMAETNVDNPHAPRESVTSPPPPPPAAALSSASALSQLLNNYDKDTLLLALLMDRVKNGR